jgi:hypothetical protein
METIEAPSLASSVAPPADEAPSPAPASGSQRAAPPPADTKSDTAVVANEAKPAKPAPAPGAPEGKPATPAKPAAAPEQPAAKATPAKPDAPAAEADLPDLLEDDLLSDEDIEKKLPANTPKWARAQIKQLTTRLRSQQELVNIVENLGGKEGMEVLMEYGDTLTNPAKFDGFKGMLEKVAPFHMKKLENEVFWGAAKQKSNLDKLVQEKLGNDEANWETVELIHQAILDGDIDLESLREKAELKLSAPERARREKQRQEEAQKDAEHEETRKKVEKLEAKEKSDRQENAVKAFVSGAEEKWKPIAQKLNLLPVTEGKDADPPEVAKFKAHNLYRLMRDVDDQLRADPDYEAWWAMVQEDQTETSAYKLKTAVVLNKQKAIFKRLADEGQRFFTAAIAGFNGKEIAAIKDLPSEPSGVPSVSSPVDAPAPGAFTTDEAARKKAFTASLEREISRAVS